MNRKNSLLLPPQFFETDSDKKIRTILDLGVDSLYLFDHFKNPTDSTKPTYIFTEEILSLFEIFDNEAFVLGGSMSSEPFDLIDLIQIDIKNRYKFPSRTFPDVFIASQGEDSGIIGAAALAFDE